MRRLGTLPLWAVACAIFVLSSAVLLAVSFVLVPLAASEIPFAERLISAVVVAAVMTVAFTASIHRARVRAGGAEALQRMQRPMRLGEVPADADPVTWTAIVDAQYRALHRRLWTGPLAFGLLTLGSLWLAIVQGPAWWIGVAIGVSFLVLTAVSTRRALRTTIRMRGELARRRGC